MGQEFTGTDFVKALAEGALKNHIVREGLAKQQEKDAKSILFSEGDCTDWIPIPVKMIEKVEFIRNMPCKDHEHPFVRLHLKSPVDNPEAEVFSRLLASSSHCLGSVVTELGSFTSSLPQQADLVEPDGVASVPHLQSSGTPVRGQFRICCHIECQIVAIATGSGGIVFRRVCYLSNCRYC